ncbi:YbaB/EbfC family nucleoid-associated protein [Actinokineospora sp. G85]|uniref:YbaB/EbfC family nucleoid-associated protein n=1 Tax=Actinokineospora sp. G85 TaxID=3406626 RepID=UPI003C7650D3
MHDIQRIWQRVAAIEETACSHDGRVSASVGARGELRTLVLDPRVYRDRDTRALAKSVVDTIAEATRHARCRVLDEMAPLLARDDVDTRTDLAFGPLLHHLTSRGR